MNLKIEYVKIADIQKYEGNSRTHSEHQIEQLAASIRLFGFVNPVLIDGDTVLIAGEGRVEGAKRAGLTKVPAIRLTHLSERERKALVIADNRIALSSGWDFQKLSAELGELAELDFDLDITGFDEQELDALLKADASILPEAFGAEPTGSAGDDQSGDYKEPAARQEAKKEHRSLFELAMADENKERLIVLLETIKEDNALQTLEDAMLQLMWTYENN